MVPLEDVLLVDDGYGRGNAARGVGAVEGDDAAQAVAQFGAFDGGALTLTVTLTLTISHRRGNVWPGFDETDQARHGGQLGVGDRRCHARPPNDRR